ncbi:hypothetical protein BJV74DRAFT_246007 [Russula compacta]|nr:hypothetical protein BJV74DRAFT_246007 [Russula compacta]
MYRTLVLYCFAPTCRCLRCQGCSLVHWSLLLHMDPDGSQREPLAKAQVIYCNFSEQARVAQNGIRITSLALPPGHAAQGSLCFYSFQVLRDSNLRGPFLRRLTSRPSIRPSDH